MWEEEESERENIGWSKNNTSLKMASLTFIIALTIFIFFETPIL